jgi:hypothetical protein
VNYKQIEQNIRDNDFGNENSHKDLAIAVLQEFRDGVKMPRSLVNASKKVGQKMNFFDFHRILDIIIESGGSEIVPDSILNYRKNTNVSEVSKSKPSLTRNEKEAVENSKKDMYAPWDK